MRAVGIILAGGNSRKMKELTSRRAAAAMPVAGSYRAIDFTLSNMTNSHIQKVAVLTQYNARSLNEHLNSSKWWDFGRKQGGLYVFTPTITDDNGYWYRGTADAIYQNLDFLRRCHEPYVIITSGDAVYKMDYNKVLEYHIAKRADVTVVCTDSKEADTSRFGVLKMNEDCRIEEFEEKPMVSNSNVISTGIYVIRRRQLIEMIERSAQEDRYDQLTNPKLTSINKEAPRSTFTSYATEEDAIVNDRTNGASRLSLNGKWKFNYVENFADRPTDFMNVRTEVNRWPDIG